jgi:hypothetical protein
MTPLSVVSKGCLSVQERNGTKHVYHIAERRWEKCAQDNTELDAQPFPDLTEIHTYGISVESIKQMNALVLAAPVCNIVCKLVSNSTRADLFALLVPDPTDCNPWLLFIQSTSSAAAKALQQQYKYAGRVTYYGDIELTTGPSYRLQLPQEGAAIKVEGTPLVVPKRSRFKTKKKDARKALWVNQLGLGSPAPLMQTPSGQGQMVPLFTFDMNRLQARHVDVFNEVSIKRKGDKWKGGRLRSQPVRASAGFKEAIAQLPTVPGEDYLVHKKPLTDYYLSLAENENFNQSHTPRDLAAAVQKFRRLAQKKYNVGDMAFQPILGAVMSSFYEDIGWKLAEPEPVPRANISKAVVDVDQVQP